MVFDSYDTYATGFDGEILHFDVIVAAGTIKPVVEMLVGKYVESPSPEVEAELCPRAFALQVCIAAEHRAAVTQRGFAIVPRSRQRKSVA